MGKEKEERNSRQTEQPVLRPRSEIEHDVLRETQVIPCGTGQEFQVVSNLRGRPRPG